jgi:hypothetical protein
MRRKVMFRCALGGVVLAIAGSAGDQATRAQEPTLNAVNVTFELPKCDDRDSDTRIEMSVASGGSAIASNASVAPAIHFNDPGSYGPYDLPLQQTINKSDWPATTTSIHITPRGNDTWCTKIHVDALFSDNTHIKTNNCSVVKISEDNRDYSFPTNACSE